ncbi:Plexin-A2 [Rhizoctonia solani]|uniref:Plexin-A2 n=1 Tax=Rhizoctonia solani TaxID=456999 RepID=A0A0K6GA83_9AGAM|nr:Plexin-A2 [Rhizoctonia solani]
MSKGKSVTIVNGAGSWIFTHKRCNPKSDGELPNAHPSNEIVRHPEFFFDNTLVAIQVENTLFNVHKYQLMKSEVFSDMFKMPKVNDSGPEEGSPERPIVMKGIAASDFAGLLKVLYASLFSANQPVPDASLIVPAFRLANMLNFSELRGHLLPLAEKNLNDVDKVIFAREFDIQEWLVPAYTRLCQRDEAPSAEEARKLEVDSVLFIMLIRERYRTSGLKLEFNNFYCSSCTGLAGSYSTICRGCGTNGDGRLHHYKPGAMQNGTNPTDSASIEAEVKEWVENGWTANSETIVKHPKFFFDNTLIVIQIENVQFNVHKYQLLKSDTFRDMFTIAEQSGADAEEPREGSSTENPIKMEGVSAEDFESLLTVLYANNQLSFPSHFSSHQPEPSASLIIPAFRLANMWNFSELREYLMPLAEQVLNDASKIAFAREFHVQQWIVPAYVRLCHRKEPLDSDEAKMIGLEGLLLISRIREGKYTKNPRPPCHNTETATLYCPSCQAQHTPDAVFMSEEESEGEINTWVQNGYQFSTTTPNDGSDKLTGMSDIDPTPTDDKLLGSKRLSAFFVEDPLIVIEVESTLFKVHKRLLLKSETFLDMLKASETTDDKPEEGSSPDHPIILDSVSASDFEAFLTALYAGYHPSLPGQPAPKLETPLLLTAFRLAHKWNFSDLQIYLLPLIEEALDPTSTDRKSGPKRLSTFFMEDPLVVIQVEDTLFKVHKRLLAKSETFSDMFKIAEVGNDKPKEGSSPDHPIVLESVSASAFEALLTTLYAGYHPTLPGQPAPKLEITLLIAAFGLAHMWNFADLRTYLLPLLEGSLGDLDRILFSREFDIQEWLAPAYKNLCQRPQPPTTEEARKLGVDGLLLILRMREQFRPPQSEYDSTTGYCRSCAGVYHYTGGLTCTSCKQWAKPAYARNSDTPNDPTTTALTSKIEQWVTDGCVRKE